MSLNSICSDIPLRSLLKVKSVLIWKIYTRIHMVGKRTIPHSFCQKISVFFNERVYSTSEPTLSQISLKAIGIKIQDRSLEICVLLIGL